MLFTTRGIRTNTSSASSSYLLKTDNLIPLNGSVRLIGSWSVVFLLFWLGVGSSESVGGPSLPALIQRVKPAVCTVYVFNENAETVNQGSCFFVTENLVVSSHHIFWKEGVTNGKVVTNTNNLEFPVKSVIVDDPDIDLVIVEVEPEPTRQPSTTTVTSTSFSPLNISISDLMEGEDIFVISSPVGLKGVISTGIISAIHNSYDIQISAPISTGSSGAPIFNYQGEVVGVVTGHFNTGQNLNFGISVNGIIELIQKIEEERPPSSSSSASPVIIPNLPPGISSSNLLTSSPTSSARLQTLPASNPCKTTSDITPQSIGECYPTLQQWIEDNMESSRQSSDKRSFFYLMQFFTNLKNFTKGIWNHVTNSTLKSPVFLGPWKTKKTTYTTNWEGEGGGGGEGGGAAGGAAGGPGGTEQSKMTKVRP